MARVSLSRIVRSTWPNGESITRKMNTTDATNTTDTSKFPALGGTDVVGWMFLNLANQAVSGVAAPANVYTAQRVGFRTFSAGTAPPARGSRDVSQNWVVISMFGAVGANRLSVDFDAAWLGNGCSAGQAAGEQIAPVNERFGPLVCPTNTPASNCGVGTDAPEVNP